MSGIRGKLPEGSEDGGPNPRVTSTILVRASIEIASEDTVAAPDGLGDSPPNTVNSLDWYAVG